MTREEAIKFLEETSFGGEMLGDKNLVAVCDLAISALREQEERRWIPVTECLPQNYISVLVYIPTAEPLPMVHEAYIGDDEEWHSSVFYGIENEDVTHWMPMPEPPKEEKGK